MTLGNNLRVFVFCNKDKTMAVTLCYHSSMHMNRPEINSGWLGEFASKKIIKKRKNLVISNF